MKKRIDEFNSLISMIQMATTEDDFKIIAVRNYNNKLVYGEMHEGFIDKPFELHIMDKDNICQYLHDCLINTFGEQLVPGYSYSLDGSYRYFMTFEDKAVISFPEGYEYEDWIYNQVQEDIEKYSEKGKGK